MHRTSPRQFSGQTIINLCHQDFSSFTEVKHKYCNFLLKQNKKNWKEFRSPRNSRNFDATQGTQIASNVPSSCDSNWNLRPRFQASTCLAKISEKTATFLKTNRWFRKPQLSCFFSNKFQRAWRNSLEIFSRTPTHMPWSRYHTGRPSRCLQDEWTSFDARC